MKFHFCSKRKGFTLAEVLVTLGILGIIAAITLPPLINGHRKTVYATQIKKNYAEVSQVLQNIMRDSGSNNLLQAGFCKDGSYNDAQKALRDNFKITTDCGLNSYNNGTACFANQYKSLDRRSSFNSFYGYKVALPSGAALSLYCYWNGGNLNAPVASLTIDTNGPKGPNLVGRDFFRMYIFPEGIIDGYNVDFATRKGFNAQYGGSASAYRRERNFNSWCKSSTSGDGCIDKLINDNWKMNY